MTVTANADKVAKSLTEYARGLTVKIKEFTHALAEIGRQAADGAFGGEAVHVDIQEIQGGYVVSANGEQIVFLEFGAGTMVDEADKYAATMPFPVESGSWSRTEGTGEFARTNKWHYMGVEFEYIMPRNGMQRAYEAIMQAIEAEARRVFGS